MEVENETVYGRDRQRSAHLCALGSPSFRAAFSSGERPANSW